VDVRLVRVRASRQDVDLHKAPEKPDQHDLTLDDELAQRCEGIRAADPAVKW
jgi:hypothetical protein